MKNIISKKKFSPKIHKLIFKNFLDMMLQGHGEKNVVKKIPSKIFFYYLEKFGTGEELDFRCLNFYLTLGKWFLRQNSRHVPRTVTRSHVVEGRVFYTCC